MQDLALGMSWREQKELKKALYASLQEQQHKGSAGGSEGSATCSIADTTTEFSQDGTWDSLIG